MNFEELQERFYQVGVGMVSANRYSTGDVLRQKAITRAAKSFKRRFGGLFNRKMRTEEETLRLIQEMRIADNMSAARNVMEGLQEHYLRADRHIGFPGNLFCLVEVRNARGERGYRIRTHRDYWVD